MSHCRGKRRWQQNWCIRSLHKCFPENRLNILYSPQHSANHLCLLYVRVMDCDCENRISSSSAVSSSDWAKLQLLPKYTIAFLKLLLRVMSYFHNPLLRSECDSQQSSGSYQVSLKGFADIEISLQRHNNNTVHRPCQSNLQSK